MILKTHFVIADNVTDLETAVNAFLADKDPDNVLNIFFGPAPLGANTVFSCGITYKE